MSRTSGFFILSVHARIADVRIGERDNLAAVGRVSQDLLIPGHRGIEHHLAHCRTESTNGMAAKNRAIFQCEDSGLRQTDLPVVVATRAKRVHE